MSRMLKSKLPMSTFLLKPRVVMKAQEELKERSDRQKMYYDQNVKPLPQIMEDDTVQIRKGKERKDLGASHCNREEYSP